MKALLLLLLAALTFAADNSEWLRPKMNIPADNALTKERIELGKLLFFDKRLSQSNTISCGTCHDPYMGWSDGKAKAVGHGNHKGRRNTPTIVNAGYLNSFFWDGRASSLEEQAIGPMEAGVEMNLPIGKVVEKLKNIEGYAPLFEAAYPGEGITKNSIAKAIASFERTVISENSPFDRWILGDKTAMSEDAVKGFELFEEVGRCHKCHSGFNFTNEKYANIALGDPDLGVYEQNKKKIWYATFKTPTLREVTKTAPYFHDGSVHTLEEAVHICGNGGRYKDIPRSPFFRNREINTYEMRKIVAFLEMLSSDDEAMEVPREFPR